MKKLFLLLLGLILFYVIVTKLTGFLSDGHSISYTLKKESIDFNITEKFNKKDNYYDFNVVTSKYKYRFLIYSDFNKDKKIIENIYNYKDENYFCILPIFKNKKVETDFMCINNNIIYPYHTIKGKNKKLDKYISTIDIYDESKFLDDLNKTKEKENIKVYFNNLNDEILALNNYRGVYLISDEIKNIKLFENDAYNQKLNYTFLSNYVVPNYDLEYDFNSLYIVDMKTGSTKTMKTPQISFDSYIQGIYDGSIYLVDKSNKKQYELDIDGDKVYEVGNEKKGTKYYDGVNLTSKSMIQTLNKELKFENVKEVDDYFVLNNNLKRYIYFKRSENGFDVYKSYTLNKDLIYLFHINNYRQVKFSNNSIYLIEDNNLIRYNDYSGKRTLLTNTEFEFNNNLYYYVYHN